MCVKSGQGYALKAIQELREYGSRDRPPRGHDGRCHCKGLPQAIRNRLRGQEYRTEREERRPVETEPVLRPCTQGPRTGEELFRKKGVFTNVAEINRDYYYKVTYDPAMMIIKSFELNEKKVEKARRLSGFFAIMIHDVDFGAMETYLTYSLHDEQNKYFQQMKGQMVTDRQRRYRTTSKHRFVRAKD